jgi:hypothetical protein
VSSVARIVSAQCPLPPRAQALDALVELLASTPQARGDRSQRYSEQSGYLGRGQFLELGQDEHDAQVVVRGIENVIEHFARALLVHKPLRIRLRLNHVGERLFVADLPPARLSAPRVGRNVEGRAEEKSTLPSVDDGRLAAKRDAKDFLGGVVNVRLADAQASQRTPDEIV